MVFQAPTVRCDWKRAGLSRRHLAWRKILERFNMLLDEERRGITVHSFSPT
jgi:hypothetical protein